MASALQDSWMVGIAAMRHILPPGTMTSADALPTAQEDIARQSQMALLVTQSYLAIATGSFRYFNGLTQTFAAHQHSIFSHLVRGGLGAQLSEESQRAMTESVRAYLREVGELAEREARLMQTELAQLAEAITHAAPASDTRSDRQRRWKVKL